MAELTEKIAITGGEEITRTFNQIGASGEQAFKRIEQAVAGGIKSARSFGNAFEDQVRHVLELGFAVKKLTDFIRSGAEAGQKLENLAQGVGLTTEQLSGLGFAAGQTGVEFDKFTTLVGRFDRAVGEAHRVMREFAKDQRELVRNQQRARSDLSESQSRQSADARRADELSRKQLTEDERRAETRKQLSRQQSRESSDLARSQRRAQEDLNRKLDESENLFIRFGITLKNSDGTIKTTNELLLEVADRFSRIPDSAQKSADAFTTFGRGASAIIPFLNRGRKGIEEYIAVQKRLAPELTKAEQQIGTNFNNALRLVEASVTSVKNSFLTVISQPLTPFFNELAETVARSRAGLLQLAQVLAGKLSDTIELVLKFLNENPTALVKGVDIATKSLVSFGNGAKLAVNIFKGAFDSIAAVLDHTLVPALKGVATVIDQVFGTELNGTISDINGTTVAWAATIAILILRFDLLTAAIKGTGAAIVFVSTVMSGLLGLAALTFIAVAAATLVIALGPEKALEKAKNLFNKFKVDFLGQLSDQDKATKATNDSIIKNAEDTLKLEKKSAEERNKGIDGSRKKFDELGKSGANAAKATTNEFVIGSAKFIQIKDTATQALEEVKIKVQETAASIAPAFNEAVNQIVEGGNKILTTYTTVAKEIDAKFDATAKGLEDNFESIEQKAEQTAQSIQSDFSEGIPGNPDSGLGFASGGQVHGRPGRDKIPAWLTNREFVHKTAAVDYYGVRFMHAINRMLIPREAFRGFNLGGLVSIPTQQPLRFANGGQATGAAGLRPLSLTIGADTFAGLLAPEAVAQRLIKVATARATHSAGRKPSGYGG